jgi:hypothetical protein
MIIILINVLAKQRLEYVFLQKNILMHVVQIETPIMQEQKQLQEYNTPNNQFGNQQYNSRPNG